MVDYEKVKKGDKLYVINWMDIYEPDDGVYAISLPVGVKSVVVEEKTEFCTIKCIKTTDSCSRDSSDLYYTKDETEEESRKLLLECWEKYKCDKIIKDLLKIQKLVKKIRDEV